MHKTLEALGVEELGPVPARLEEELLQERRGETMARERPTPGLRRHA